MGWRRLGDKPLPDPFHRRIYAALRGDKLNLDPSREVIILPVKYGMSLLIHSQTSTHACLIHAGI